jgi:hypothetical protein
MILENLFADLSLDLNSWRETEAAEQKQGHYLIEAYGIFWNFYANLTPGKHTLPASA